MKYFIPIDPTTDKPSESVICRENEDGSISWIPKDLANVDYQLYLNPEETSAE